MATDNPPPVPANLDTAKLPQHVAIIMDGNGRWAVRRKQPRTAGHQAGLSTVKEIVRECSVLGIPYLSLYAFSTENWKRATEEVSFLMDLIVVYLKAEYDFYRKNRIRVVHSGNLAGLPEKVQKELIKASEDTASHDGLTVNLAINYGGRNEIVRAMQRAIKKARQDSLEQSCDFETMLERMDEASFQSCLDEPDLPDVDLLVRTGGEKRISNFMLWKGAYAELYFSDLMWPDWNVASFHEALNDYKARQRRFGASP